MNTQATNRMKRKYAFLYIAMIVVSLFATVAVAFFARLGTLPENFFI